MTQSNKFTLSRLPTLPTRTRPKWQSFVVEGPDQHSVSCVTVLRLLKWPSQISPVALEPFGPSNETMKVRPFFDQQIRTIDQLIKTTVNESVSSIHKKADPTKGCPGNECQPNATYSFPCRSYSSCPAHEYKLYQAVYTEACSIDLPNSPLYDSHDSQSRHRRFCLARRGAAFLV